MEKNLSTSELDEKVNNGEFEVKQKNLDFEEIEPSTSSQIKEHNEKDTDEMKYNFVMLN